MADKLQNDDAKKSEKSDLNDCFMTRTGLKCHGIHNLVKRPNYARDLVLVGRTRLWRALHRLWFANLMAQGTPNVINFSAKSACASSFLCARENTLCAGKEVRRE
jgi:hypothetical protein